MEIEWLCSEILHAAKTRDAKYRTFWIPSKLALAVGGEDPNKKTEIEIEFDATREQIKLAFDELVRLRLFKYVNRNDANAVIVSNYGEYIRENGGFSRILQEKRQKEIDDSVIKTNNSVISTNKWQKRVSTGLSVVAIIISIFAYLKKDVNKYQVELPPQKQVRQDSLRSMPNYIYILPLEDSLNTQK